MSNGFDISQFDSWTRHVISEVENKYPNQMKAFMRSEAGKLRTQTKSTARVVKRKTGNYLAGWKKGKKVYEYGGDKYNIMVYNSSPHAHLIEYGFHHSPNGSPVSGKPVMDNAMEAFQSKFYADVENKLVDYLVKGIERS